MTLAAVLPVWTAPAMQPQRPEMGVVDQATANSGSGVPAAAMERIVIKNADLAIVVSDVNGRMKNIQIMAEQMGGFVVSSNLYKAIQTITSKCLKRRSSSVCLLKNWMMLWSRSKKMWSMFRTETRLRSGCDSRICGLAITLEEF